MVPLSARPAIEPPRRVLRAVVAASVAALLASAAPAAAQAQGDLPGGDCDFPVVETTTDLTYDCAGRVPEQGSTANDPPATVPSTRRCRRTYRTGALRAHAVNCGTARGVARRRRGRARYRALGFSCRTGRSGLVRCRRRARTGPTGAVVVPAASVLFRPTRRSR